MLMKLPQITWQQYHEGEVIYLKYATDAQNTIYFAYYILF